MNFSDLQMWKYLSEDPENFIQSIVEIHDVKE